MKPRHECPTCGDWHCADTEECVSCRRSAIAALSDKPFMSKPCTHCGQFFTVTYDERKRYLCHVCRHTTLDRKWHSRITAMVHTAVSLGILPKLDGTIPCMDCGKPATDYDHRDYNKPLDVDPTCHSCNLKRGPAIPLRSAQHAVTESEAA